VDIAARSTPEPRAPVGVRGWVGFVVGFGLIWATLPFAYLYELGGRTIWAPALVHAAIDTFRALTVDPADTMVFSLYVSALALVVPLVAFPLGRLVRRR
jgi:hypothetical protein